MGDGLRNFAMNLLRKNARTALARGQKRYA
jgi:hypothetical protein